MAATITLVVGPDGQLVTVLDDSGEPIVTVPVELVALTIPLLMAASATVNYMDEQERSHNPGRFLAECVRQACKRTGMPLNGLH